WMVMASIAPFDCPWWLLCHGGYFGGCGGEPQPRSDGRTWPRPQALVNAPTRDSLSGTAEFLGDRLDQTGVHRLNRGRKHGGDAAVTPDQVFVEVPARHFERALGGGPLVERMRVGAAHLGFGGERKAHAVL